MKRNKRSRGTGRATPKRKDRKVIPIKGSGEKRTTQKPGPTGPQSKLLAGNAYADSINFHRASSNKKSGKTQTGKNYKILWVFLN